MPSTRVVLSLALALLGAATARAHDDSSINAAAVLGLVEVRVADGGGERRHFSKIFSQKLQLLLT